MRDTSGDGWTDWSYLTSIGLQPTADARSRTNQPTQPIPPTRSKATSTWSRSRPHSIPSVHLSLPSRHHRDTGPAAAAACPGPAGGSGGGPVVVGRGGAGVRVLQRDVPDRGGRGLRGDARHPAGGRHAGAVAAPDALPRLLRPGLRRLGHAQVQERHRGAGRRPEPEHAGLRRRREDQGQARDALPAHRLLRRHHRHGRQRRRAPEPGAVVRGGDRAARRQRHSGRVRRQRPGAARLQHRRRQDLLQRQVAQLQGHRRPLRFPQHRHVPLRGVPEAAVQLHGRHGPGPDAGRALREAAEEALPARRRPRQDQGAHRPGKRLHLRPQLLPPRARHGRPLPVRRQPPPRRRHQGLRREDGQRLVARRVLQGLRGGHGQDGAHRRAPRQSGGGQGHLWRFC